jgi:hypothetical protein
MATDVERLIEQIKSLSLEDQSRVRDALNLHLMPDLPSNGQSPELEFQLRLVEAGLLAEIKRPRRDEAAFKDRKLVEVKGKPLSRTIIDERR